MEVLSVRDVFTPASPATHTFVDRMAINNILVDAIMTKGKQMVVYGHSGTGKTTLLHNKLNQTYDGFIVSRCTSNMLFEQLVLNAFDQLNQFFISGASKSKSQKLKASISNDYQVIKSTLGIDIDTTSSVEARPIVPPQLTPQKLASFFGNTRQ